MPWWPDPHGNGDSGHLLREEKKERDANQTFEPNGWPLLFSTPTSKKVPRVCGCWNRNGGDKDGTVAFVI